MQNCSRIAPALGWAALRLFCTSALLRITDSTRTWWDVRKVPIPEVKRSCSLATQDMFARSQHNADMTRRHIKYECVQLHRQQFASSRQLPSPALLLLSTRSADFHEAQSHRSIKKPSKLREMCPQHSGIPQHQSFHRSCLLMAYHLVRE